MNKHVLPIALCLLVTGVGFAQEQKPEAVPVTRFERMEVLQYVDFATRRVTIGGATYPLAAGMKWYGLEPGVKPETQSYRINGKRVGYILAWNGSVPVVTAIWVVPE